MQYLVLFLADIFLIGFIKHLRTSAEIMAGNLVWMNLIGLFTAAIFVLVFAILYKGIPRKGVKKGIIYGLLLGLFHRINFFPISSKFM